MSGDTVGAAPCFLSSRKKIPSDGTSADSSRHADGRNADRRFGSLSVKKRRSPLAPFKNESAALTSGISAAAAARQRSRNAQVKQYDPVTRRFIFLSFARQLQQQLKHHVSPLHRTGALDLLQQQQIWLQHSVGCAGVQRPKVQGCESTPLRLRSALELDYCAFREVVQEYKVARISPLLAALLAELHVLSSTLPLLLLEQQRVVQLLLCHVMHEECCTAVLALLQALAKDLRAEVVTYLPSIFSTLLLLLQQLESTRDASRLTLVFNCVSNIFRYLAKPLLEDFRSCLELYLPWLCGAAASSEIAPHGREQAADALAAEGEHRQKAHTPLLRQCEALQASLDENPEAALDSNNVAAAAGKENAQPVGAKRQSTPVGKRCPSRGTLRRSEMNILAAQAFACLLRKAAADEDEGTLLRCVEELMLCFHRCPPVSWPGLAEVFGRVLFESIRSFHHSLSSSFDRLLRFLLATVVFQKPYKVAMSGNEFSPSAAASYLDPEVNFLLAEGECTDESQRSPEENMADTQRAREGNKRRRKHAGATEDEGTLNCSDAPPAEHIDDITKHEEGEHVEQLMRESPFSIGTDLAADADRRVARRDTVQRTSQTAPAFPKDASRAPEAMEDFPYFYQVNCVAEMLKFIRMHVGNMQSKAALDVQALLMEFLAAALEANVAPEADAASVLLNRSAGGNKHVNLTERYSTLAAAIAALTRGASKTDQSDMRSAGTGDSSSGALVCGSGSAPLHGLLHSSFATYFYEHPSPRSLTSHPYFRACGRWIFTRKSGHSHTRQQKAGFTQSGSSDESSLSAARELSTMIREGRQLFFLGYGLLTVLEFVGEWVYSLPRLQGSFDSFVKRLLLLLAPLALSPNQEDTVQTRSSWSTYTWQKKTFTASTPLILRPLVRLLCSAPASCTSPVGLRGMQRSGKDLWGQQFCEVAVAFAVTLPCALLRLVAITWRAIPNSFSAALSTLAPQLLPHLLLNVPISEEASSVVKDAHPHALDAQHSQIPPQRPAHHSWGCWHRQIGELYSDCCISFLSLLQRPDLLLSGPEACSGRVHAFVERFALHALRPAFKFLLRSLSGQTFAASPPCRPAQPWPLQPAFQAHDASNGEPRAHFFCKPVRLVISWSQWRKSASAVLLAEQLRFFSEVLLFGTHAVTTAYLRRGLDVLTAALDEMLCCINNWKVAGAAPSVEAQAEVLVFAWGLLTVGHPLLSCLAARPITPVFSKAAGGPALENSGDKEEEEEVSRAGMELQARLLKVVVIAIEWVVKRLTSCTDPTKNKEMIPDLAAEYVENVVAITTQGQRSITASVGEGNKVEMLGRSNTEANPENCEKLPVMYMQLMGQCFDCLFALAKGGGSFKTRILIPPPCTRHLKWVSQRLSAVGKCRAVDIRKADGNEKANTDNSRAPVRGVSLRSDRDANEGGSQTLVCQLLQTLFEEEKAPQISAEDIQCSEIGFRRTCPGDVVASEAMTSSLSECMERDSCTALDEAPASAQWATGKWAVLLLSIFDAAATGSSSTALTEACLLPLLQCTLNCLQAAFADLDCQGGENAEEGAVAASAARRYALVHSPGESRSTPADRANKKKRRFLTRNQGVVAVVSTAVSASLPAILPCLSSPCRSLRLTAARLLLHCTTAPKDFLRDSAAASRITSHFVSSSSWGADFSRGSGGDEAATRDGGDVFLRSCGDLFQQIVDLESTKIALSEERRLTRLLENISRSTVHMMQNEGEVAGDKSEPLCRRKSTAREGSCWQGAPASPVLLAYECAVRILVAQFSVKFSPLWSAAIDALVQLMEGLATIGKLEKITSGPGMRGDSSGPTTATFLSNDADKLAAENLSTERFFLRGVSAEKRRNALLHVMWQIVVQQVQRAEGALERPAPRASIYRNDARDFLVRNHDELLQQDATGKADGNAVRDCSSTLRMSECSCSGVDEPAEKSTSADLFNTRNGSTSRAVVWSAWRLAAPAEFAGSQSVSGHNEGEEADFLSRHTQLLRVIENINRITFVTAQKKKCLQQCVVLPKFFTGFSAAPHVYFSNTQRTQQDRENYEIDSSKKNGEKEKNKEEEKGETATCSPSDNRRSRTTFPAKVIMREMYGAAQIVTPREGKPKCAGYEPRLCTMTYIEDLKRTEWTLAEALRYVDTLTADASNDSYTSPSAVNQRRLPDGTRAETTPQNESIPCDASEGQTFHTARVSLVPRACNVLRAVVALGSIQLPRRSSFTALYKASVQPEQSPRSPLHASEAKSSESSSFLCELGSDDSMEGLSLARSVSDMWTRLLASCSQRLVAVADPTLQQLTLKVLQLSPTLRPRLRPYAAVLEQLIANKAVSDILVRLRVEDDRETARGDFLEGQHAPLDDGEKLLHEEPPGYADRADVATRNEILVQRNDKGVVLPLLVRLLLTKIQQRVTKRSATSSFSQRRMILAFISSVATKELPFVLAVLLHPLVCVQRTPQRVRHEVCHASLVMEMTGCSQPESKQQKPLSDANCGVALCSMDKNIMDSSSSSTISVGCSTKAGLRKEPLTEVPFVLSGFEKEEALREVVIGKCVRLSEVFQGDGALPVGNTREGPGSFVGESLAIVLANDRAAAAKNTGAGEQRMAVGKPGEPQILERQLHEDGSVIAVSLAAACLPSQSLSRLRGCLETLKQLQDVVGQPLRPAAPFLMRFYCTVLQQVAARPSFPSETPCHTDGAASSSTRTTQETTKSTTGQHLFEPAETRKAHMKSVNQKVVVHSVLLLLEQLLRLFPDDAATWQKLLQPAADTLQQLLDTAVATAAAAPVSKGGTGSNGRQEKKSIPAVISLIVSWAAHPAYYFFFTTLLPDALTTLFSVPAAPAVLRAVYLKPRVLRRHRTISKEKTLGVLDAVVDVALQISSGGFSAEAAPQTDVRRSKRRRLLEDAWRQSVPLRRKRDSDANSSSSSSSEDETAVEELKAGSESYWPQHDDALQREQEELSHAHYQQNGMRILRPYLPRLLKSLETLFQHRAKAAERTRRLSAGPSSILQSIASSPPTEPVDPDENLNLCRRKEGSCEEGSSTGGVVTVKELHLLTRIAQFTADEHEEAKLSDPARRPVTPQGAADVRGGAPRITSQRVEDTRVASRLIHLLLQCLWHGAACHRADSREGAATKGGVRRLLILQVLRRLTLPLAVQARALLRFKDLAEKSEAGVNPGTVADEGKCGRLSLVEGTGNGSLIRAGDRTSTDVETGRGHRPTSDTGVIAVLRLVVLSGCKLLQECRSLRCRRAASELLLAAELAACGLSHSDKLLSDLIKEVGTLLRRSRGDHGDSILRTLDGHPGPGEVDWEGGTADIVVKSLLPGGSLLNDFLQKAVALSREEVRNSDRRPVNVEQKRRTEEDPTKLAACEVKPTTDSACPQEAKKKVHWRCSYLEDGGNCDFLPSLPLLSVLARQRVQRSRLSFGGDGSQNRKFNGDSLPPKGKDTPLQMEDLVIRTQWHIGAALIILCLNASKGYCGEQRLAVHSITEDDDVPDSDVHILILSSLAKRCIVFDVPLPRTYSPAVAGSRIQKEEFEDGGEGSKSSSASLDLQFFHRQTMAVTAMEPVVRQCLYLLASPVAEWTVQQAALNVLKRLIDAVGAAAAYHAAYAGPQSASPDAQRASQGRNVPVSVCSPAFSGPVDADRREEITSMEEDSGPQLHSMWRAVGNYGRELLSLLAELLMPSARLLLKHHDQEQWRIGVQIIEHVMRSFVPVTQSLAELIISAECGGFVAGKGWPAADIHRCLRQLQQNFNLDMSCLSLPVSPVASRDQHSSTEQHAAGWGTGKPAVGDPAAVQAAVIAACNRNAGGDFFIDLLHVQRHRRGRALQRMALAAEAGLLSRGTLQVVGLPLSLGAVLQRDSCATKQQQHRLRSARHRQLFNQGLCEQGLKCLEACCARVPWKRCLRLIQVLASFLVRLPQREAYIYRAICIAARAFEEQGKTACAGACLEAKHSAASLANPPQSTPFRKHCPGAGGIMSSGTTAATNGFVSASCEAATLPRDGVDAVRRPKDAEEVTAAVQFVAGCQISATESESTTASMKNMVEEAAVINKENHENFLSTRGKTSREKEKEDEKDGETKATNVFNASGKGVPSSSNPEGTLNSLPSASSCRLKKMQNCVRAELLPLLFKLTFTCRQAKALQSDRCGVLEVGSVERRHGEHPKPRLRARDDDNKVINPTLVVVCIVLMRLLPAAEFEEQLPRLIRLVAHRLRSRNRDVRRQARGGLVSAASVLGVQYVPFLARELAGVLLATPKKSNNFPQCEQASTGSQAFAKSVFLFTLHAIIHHVLNPLQARRGSASGSDGAKLQKRSGVSPRDAAEEFRGTVSSRPSETQVLAGGRATAGCLDDAMPMLLPVVAEELARTCDCDRPFRDVASSKDNQNVKNDEAKHPKGAALIHLLASVCSAASCEELMVPFFSALLTGVELMCAWRGVDRKGAPLQSMVVRQRQGFSSTAAFSAAYFERIQELLFHFAKGLHVNAGLTVGFKLRFSRRLLVLAVSIMQQMCLHPLHLSRFPRKELLELALAQQQAELQASRHPIGSSRHVKALDINGSDPLQSVAAARKESSLKDHVLAQGRRDCSGSAEVQAHRGPAGVSNRANEAVRQDMEFFRNALLVTSFRFSETNYQRVSAGSSALDTRSRAQTGGKGDVSTFLVDLNSQSAAAHALRVADVDRRESLRAALASQNDSTMLTQPGAATGKSLEQAVAAQRAAKGRGGGGFDDNSRAAAIGGIGLRLLLLTMKKHKAQLLNSGAAHMQAHFVAKSSSRQKDSETRGGNTRRGSAVMVGESNCQMVESALCAVELEKCVENVACCFCSAEKELVAWSARCLTYMLSLKLREVDKHGCLIAYCALRVFQMAGENGTAAQQKQRQLLLAPCTRLLAYVLLRPQSSTWVDKALYGIQNIPRTHGEFLRRQLQNQAKHQTKMAAARQSLLPEASFRKACSSSLHQLRSHTSATSCDAGDEDTGHASQSTISSTGRLRATSLQVATDECGGGDVYRQSQAKLLQAVRDEPLVAAADIQKQQVKFREALVAQIAHGLEDSQRRLSALMLFKTVVLPHYREAAAAALTQSKMEQELADDADRAAKGHAKSKLRVALQKKGTLAECWLLREVYRCVDLIVRFMIQEAGDSGENKRLAALCADVYVHFLLNFPMTAKAQQRKVFLLIRNMGYAAVDGRRAVLNCMHKLFCRFPYELTVEKYCEIGMIALCRRLVLEEDSVTHSMLRMLVGQLMQIAEDLQDGRHSSVNLLRTCYEILLQPKVPNLLAIEELILIFVDVQAARGEHRLLQKILPLVHHTLEVSEAAHGPCAFDGPAPSTWKVSRPRCRQGCCDGVDWRVCYKALLVFEKILLCTHSIELDRIFGNTVRAVQQLYRSLPSTQLLQGFPTGEGVQLRMPLNSCKLSTIETMCRCQQPGEDALYGQMMVASEKMAELTWSAGTVPPRASQDLEAGNLYVNSTSNTNTLSGRTLASDSPDVASACALARVWLLAAGVGLTHSHPWIRAISFRCIGLYLAAKLSTDFSENSMCLLYLPLDTFSRSSLQKAHVADRSTSSVTRVILRKCLPVERDTIERHSLEDGALSQFKTVRTTQHAYERQENAHPCLDQAKTMQNNEQISSSTPYTGLSILSDALKVLHKDEFLERCPQAVPSVYGLLVALVELSVKRPDLLSLPGATHARAFNERNLKEYRATYMSPDNVDPLRKDVERGSEASDVSVAPAGISKVGISEVYKRYLETLHAPGAEIARVEDYQSISRKGSGSTKCDIFRVEAAVQKVPSSEKRPTSSESFSPSLVLSHSSSDVLYASEATRKSSDTLAEANDLFVPGKDSRDTAFKNGEKQGLEAFNDITYNDADSLRKCRVCANSAVFCGFAKLKNMLMLPAKVEADKPHSPYVHRKLFTFEEQAAALAASSVPFQVQQVAFSPEKSICHVSVGGGKVDGTGETYASSFSISSGPRASRWWSTTDAAVPKTIIEEEQASEGGHRVVDAGKGGFGVVEKPLLKMMLTYSKERDASHPLVRIAQRLNFLLRLHLGSLGRRSVYKDACQRSYKCPGVDADMSKSSSSVIRVSTILSVLQAILHILPLRALLLSTNQAAATGEEVGLGMNRSENFEHSRLSRNQLAPHEDCAKSQVSMQQVMESLLSAKANKGEVWVSKVALLILETFFRCSTLVKHETSRQGLNRTGETLVQILTQQEVQLDKGQEETFTETEMRDTNHFWVLLSALDPKEQQVQIVAAGTFLLDRFRATMSAVGMDDAFIQLLAKIRGKVSKQRMERKVLTRQQAVLQPRLFAERRRNRQKRKSVVKSLALLKKKRKGVIRHLQACKN